MDFWRWLRGGRAEARAAAAEKPERRVDITEFGASGTPIFSGFLRDAGEYNPKLSGLTAYATYEQMRRSDAQVAATLAAIKLPIRSAGWTVVAPENATPVEEEAAELVKSCLLEEIDFDAVIENALLMLDFGAAAHEDVWYVDGSRVRIKKLAPRLPLTFYRWICAPGSDELVALEQQGYRGDKFVTATVPIEKLALFTYQQEGANFAGRSLLRAMYQSWYIKSNLYKIDAIACERNGLGIPVVNMGREAKAEDKRTAFEWLQRLAANEKASILLPQEWTFSLEGVKGTLRDPKDSIAHHNMQISMAGLTMFMNLGQTQTGARSLGETMTDFFAQTIQATANRIARVINLATVKRLVDFNFGAQERYPKLVPAEIGALSLDAVVSALKELANGGVNVIQPDVVLEAWLLKKLGAPAISKPRQRPLPPALPSQAEQKSEGDEDTKEPVAASETQPVVDGVRVRREPKPVERSLALGEIVGELDRGRDEIAAALRAAKSRVQAEIVNKVVNSPVRTMHRVSVAPDEKLLSAVRAVLETLYDAGVAQVEAERERQLKGAKPPDAAAVRVAMADARRQRRDDPLGVYADGVVGEFINGLTSRAVGAALDWMRRPGDLTKGGIIRRIEAELDEQSDKWLDGAAAKGANEAFADGRRAAYEEHRDEVQAVIYSALLDINTCQNCAAADGAEGATPDDIPDVPNPDCDGGDRCRCVHVFVFRDEVRG